MVIYDSELVKHLQTLGLPVYYNQFVDSTVQLPCLSYEPVHNISTLEGMNNHSNIFYSRIDYYIRLWGHTKKELSPYMEQVDDLMRSLGFRRTSYNELIDNTHICLVALYRATGYEKL